MKKDRIKIIYEDKNIIVVDKPSNLLTIATEKERENTLFHKTIKYLKQKNKNNKLFIVHRLDKDTSGVILFAKNEITKRYFQDNWDKIAIERKYVAVVDGQVKEKNKKIVNYLTENPNTFMSYSTKDKKIGKQAITYYSVLKSNSKYSLLDIDIKTGRKNQIRVHLMEDGHPILGDKKYGNKKCSINRMCLHAYKLVIRYNNKDVCFESKIPESFNLLFPNRK